MTIDYETWQPIPPGKRIDWSQDVFTPAERLMDMAEPLGVPVTFMAEMGEYFWLAANAPQLAQRMIEQWQEAVLRGHDVQLHLHPAWLPELGARCRDGQWWWDPSRQKADDYPGDLSALIGRCKQELEEALTPIQADYRTVAFRAGAYQAQPFRRLHDALATNGILADSSVYAGGQSVERGYDFRLAYHTHQPYFANPFDPQLKAPPGEGVIIELPVAVFEPGVRWFLDNQEGRRLAERFARHQREESGRRPAGWWRRKCLNLLARAYARWPDQRLRFNRWLPRAWGHAMAAYAGERTVDSDFFVMIGHTKAELDFEAIRANLQELKLRHGVEFITLSDMTRRALAELGPAGRTTPADEARYQVQREYRAIMGEERNAAQSFRLQEMVPLDRGRLLDLGCGAGYWSDRLARLYPWMEVTGLDFGADFITRAQERYGTTGCRFVIGDFADLQFTDASFDCVYADNTIEHAWSPSQVLREVHRVLADGGLLVAALPSDARNPQAICDNHTWKTAPHEVRMRLEDAGFVDVTIDEVDTYRELGMRPYPPSNDRMMYVRAWKRAASIRPLERVGEIMDWLYQAVRPEPIPLESETPREIVRLGRGLCQAYTIVLGSMLRSEGLDVEWLTMEAEDHPRGSGPRRIDTHEVIRLRTAEGESILDPTTNTIIPHALDAVLANPALAAPSPVLDQRYRSRGYDLYGTAFWYSRVTRCWLRSELHGARREQRVHPARQRAAA